ncbi:hypothetical protein ABT008_06795 [Micromonospora sp. NPDC002389]|uniref:hypothetical protein n=1 Tax=Micromonospora sp. NPDC002389 TaxID=3154272 RepID=UPI003321DEFD
MKTAQGGPGSNGVIGYGTPLFEVAWTRAAWNQVVWRMISPAIRSVSPGQKNGW